MDINIRPLSEKDVPEADRIFRLAFGTFLNLPDPMTFAGDSAMIATRWRAAPEAALGAYDGDTLVGSNFAARWGSFAFFGPLTVHPALWNKGVAQKLVAATTTLFDRWGVAQRGLFTFPESPKHIGLYRKFGFERQALTPVMTKTVAVQGASSAEWEGFTELSVAGREAALSATRKLTDALMPGLDLGGEIAAVERQRLGEILLVRDGEGLSGFAICHVGRGSEAGSNQIYAKFAAVRPGKGAAERFEQLVAACEAFARARGVARLVAGVNAARDGAHAILHERGFTTLMEGVAMQSPDAPGFNRPDCFVIDDWR